MAVLPMKKINIYGLNRNRKPILELLQHAGCLEINEISYDDEIFEKTDISSAKTLFENSQKTLTSAVAVLDRMSKPDTSMLSMFEGRTVITDEQYREIEKHSTEIIKNAQDVVSISKKISDLNADIIRNQASIESLVPWKNLDIGMRIRETTSSMIFIGTLPELHDETSLKNVLAETLPSVDSYEIEIISSNTNQTCIIVICHKKVCAELEAALRAIGFSYPASPSKLSPQERIGELSGRIEKAEKEISTNEASLKELLPEREHFLYCHDYLTMRTEKYQNLSKILKSKKTFALTGFVPKEDSEDLSSKVSSKFDCHIEIYDPSPDEDVPVKLKNNAFAAPVEGVVESYSLPGKNEIDPSSMMAIFYYFLFGLMLSDLAYGLIMVIGCSVVLAKFKNIETGLKNSIKMFLYCGISTAFWGLMFGSFFGDVIEVVSKTFFGTELSTPCLWYRPLNEPMNLLMFSLLLGIIHLFTGLGIKFYLLARQGLIKDAIYDVVFWYFLVGGAIIYFMSMQMFADISGSDFILPAIVGNVGGILACVGAVGIILTSGRESKNPTIRIMKGLYGLYGATSYISDILSYSRLLALGLATGVIASVFNQMGAMAGGGITGAIVFILVFLLGHSLNIGLNVLGAYVHSNRLEFVEFFGKFYEGGGRKFQAFSENTKHFKIKK